MNTFNDLFLELKKVDNFRKFLDDSDEVKDRYQEATFKLFAFLNLIPEFIDYDYCIGNFNRKTIKKIDEVFGLDLLKREKIEVPEKIKKLADERETARKNKDWKKADELRVKINDAGFIINDTSDGSKLEVF